jgi:hypothetical protein
MFSGLQPAETGWGKQVKATENLSFLRSSSKLVQQCAIDIAHAFARYHCPRQVSPSFEV